MSSRYEKNLTLEEEGTYHKVQVETIPPRPQTTTTKNYTTKSYEVVPSARSNHHATKHYNSHDKAVDNYTSDEDDKDNFEEWTTSKRKINHKTRQVETRVSRQLLVEDGKVIADSGPQVTTRIKEDSKVDECEKEKTPKNKSKFDAIDCAPEGESSGRVLGEKKQIQRVTREIREENMQYHDERLKELTGHDVHRRALKAPHELIAINQDERHAANSAPRGKMVHYSNKGKKYQDTDEILEVAKLAIDGSITKEVKRTKHHEEFSDTEKPDEEGEAEALRQKPVVSRSSRRHADYVNDFDDTATPSECSSVEEEDNRGNSRSRHSGSRTTHHDDGPSRSRSNKLHSRKHQNDEAFPRYEIDPLLNSLKDEDYRPISTDTYSRNHQPTSSANRYREHHTVDHRSRANESSDDEHDYHRRNQYQNQHRSPSPYSTNSIQRTTTATTPVEIPEEYRINKQRLLNSKGKGSAQYRERSFSPANKSQLSHGSLRKSHKHPKEDASVQAHLTDEEEDKKSLQSISNTSSSDINTHEKTTKHLQRNSTNQSKRNYYYGDKNKNQQQHQQQRNRSHSITSSSASSLSDPKEKLRKSGARSKDSGFRSPNDGQQQIYSVSSKSKKHQQQQTGESPAIRSNRMGAISPTPTTGSVGQRSVKTSTTTMSAGLVDRPNSRMSAKSPTRVKSSTIQPTRSASMSARDNKKASKATKVNLMNENPYRSSKWEHVEDEDGASRRAFDNISLSSLGPNATTIKVPFKHSLSDQQQFELDDQVYRHNREPCKMLDDEETGSSLNGSKLGESIDEMRKRLDRINNRQTWNPLDHSQINRNEEKRRFDYKTLVANVEPTPTVLASTYYNNNNNKIRQNVIDTYNVKVIEHNSPFYRQGLPMNELSNSIARLEILSDESNTHGCNDNNNDNCFNLSDFVKKPSLPVLPTGTDSLLEYEDDYDNVSICSSASLKSSRTYNLGSTATALNRVIKENFNAGADHCEIDDEEVFHKEVQNNKLNNDSQVESKFDRSTLEEKESMDFEKKPAAWIFDIRDGSSTAIVAPARPKEPESPKVESKTEELAESKGGKSYYIELVEKDKPTLTTCTKKQQQQEQKTNLRDRPSSIDSLYSRWNSQGTLTSSSNSNTHQRIPRRLTKPVTNYSSSRNLSNQDTTRSSRQLKPAALLDSNNQPIAASGSTCNLEQTNQRRQLPFNGLPLSNRSKSSSCLVGSTRTTKYSIYGGLRKPNGENKPVPRLSYSQAIGPKSKRKFDGQTKTPSRYLKMK